VTFLEKRSAKKTIRETAVQSLKVLAYLLLKGMPKI